MLCVNCGVNIPPEWKVIITSNACPSCGKNIIDDTMKELLDGLSEALNKMPNDPDGIAVWLLSNYELKKTGTGEPVLKFYGPDNKGKKKPRSTDDNDDKPLKIHPRKIGGTIYHQMFNQQADPPESPNGIIQVDMEDDEPQMMPTTTTGIQTFNGKVPDHIKRVIQEKNQTKIIKPKDLGIDDDNDNNF